MPTVGVDVGGTFTDIVASVDGRLVAFKLPSTPQDPSASVLEALARLGLDVFLLLHGTTVGTNTVLERKGARTAFVATRGFKDVLQIGRQTRASLYELSPQPTPTVVPPELCFEVDERVTHRGEVLVSPSAEELERLGRRLRRKGVESLAVCFLFSFVRPEHERAAGDAVPVPFVSLSHEVAPEFREYERASTTAVNAYIGPRMSGYLGKLAGKAGRLGASRVRIMHSNGGALSVAEAAHRPVTTLLSGPAAGAMAAWEVAKRADMARAISFDMGGTSTDVALLDGGPIARPGGEIDGMPIRVPMMDIHTVGAGGGSIAWLDPAGAVRVGPQSAGADPGPAAYGKGDDFTVTDANLLLGRLIPETFAAGRMRIDPDRSCRVAERLASRLGLGVGEAAAAVVALANSRMARAIRHVSLARGYDPAGLTLVAFGGGGGLHACALAEAIGIPRILFPPNPGLLSALGLLLAPVQREAVRSVMLTGPVGAGDLLADVESLIGQASGAVATEAGGPDRHEVEISADLRYEGQSWELTVPLDPSNPGGAVDAFHALHELLYGHSSPSSPVEWVALRARVSAAVPPVPSLQAEPEAEPPLPKRSALGERLPVLSRRDVVGPLDGPMVVAQADTTLYVAPGWNVRPGADGNLVLECGG
jgi:N-methylhydantoinase A